MWVCIKGTPYRLPDNELSIREGGFSKKSFERFKAAWTQRHHSGNEKERCVKQQTLKSHSLVYHKKAYPCWSVQSSCHFDASMNCLWAAAPVEKRCLLWCHLAVRLCQTKQKHFFHVGGLSTRFFFCHLLSFKPGLWEVKPDISWSPQTWLGSLERGKRIFVEVGLWKNLSRDFVVRLQNWFWSI